MPTNWGHTLQIFSKPHGSSSVHYINPITGNKIHKSIMEMIWLYSLLSLFLIVIAFKFSSTRRKRNLPPSPATALPLLGHLHLLKLPLHRTYQKLSQKLGPIFSLRLGNRLAVVVSSPAIVEECFTKNDVVLASRPRLIIGKYIGYNYTSLIGSPYGDHWRNLRRLTTLEIFSSNRLNMFQSIRQDEIRLLLQKIYRKSETDFTRVELRHMLSELNFNNIMRMVAGKRYFGGRDDDDDEEAKQFRGLIDEAFRFAGASNPNDFFPILRWIDYKGFEKNVARVSGKMDVFLQGLIDERRSSKGTNTMIDHLLSLQESQPEYYTDIIIKGIIMMGRLERRRWSSEMEVGHRKRRRYIRRTPFGTALMLMDIAGDIAAAKC
ncbi:hypothetical protein BUALT_Bualt04G0105900 [Buddleja alternifolia]|uniref:Cytochrome P450 n=1 Tax=Buddleja alternifolia TaxID=168488 RepID=A0AAV6XVC4_9LAMI|nr:hypothetical protein BUALT_Bualt04G0105900 [Buddleja alternifolia]